MWRWTYLKRAALPVVAALCFGSGVAKAVDLFVVGPEVDAADYPWQVALRINTSGGSFRCGGVLIGGPYVLTAAHCLDLAESSDYSRIRQIRPHLVEVFHGDRFYGQGRRLEVDHSWPVRIHPGWKADRSRPLAFDVAILRLRNDVQVSVVAPVKADPLWDGEAVVSGWGSFDRSDKPSRTLRAAKVDLTDNVSCQSEGGALVASRLSESMICAVSASSDACGGDSGGPLVIGPKNRPQLVGVVSWGPYAECDLAMPDGNLIGVYARSAAFADWVGKITAGVGIVSGQPAGPTFAIEPLKTEEGQ